MTNILEYLESAAENYPEKTALIDDKTNHTYKEFVNRSKEIGSYFAKDGIERKPVACFMEKSVETLELFMGVIYAGGFYCLIDPTFPKERIENILKVLQPKYVVTRNALYGEQKEKLEAAAGADHSFEIVDLDDIKADVDDEVLAKVRAQALDIDPLYCNFTSGSTGVPKGVVVNHRSTIDFIENFAELFDFSEDDVIANQAPFDFDVSVKDIYTALKCASTLVIIPKAFFSQPNKVIDMLYDNKVTSLTWAVSALCMLVRLHALKYKVPPAIKKILFSGEMMPIKQLNQWRSVYPDAMFVNLYGPTEITCNCTYHVLDREYVDGEKIPAGIAFPNEKVFLLDDEDKEVTAIGESGEICVSGTAVAIGYYNNKEVTDKVFRQNPLNPYFYERIYCTGDLGYYGEDGLLYFVGRKDFQIKHMGHRIELEEVETALNAVSIVERSCCYFDEVKNKIVACYIGSDDKGAIIEEMKKKVPEFMIPNKFVKIDDFPLTKNGKIDRKLLREMVSK